MTYNLADGRTLIVSIDTERDEIVARIEGMPDFRAMADTPEPKIKRALREYARTAGTRIEDVS